MEVLLAVLKWLVVGAGPEALSVAAAYLTELDLGVMAINSLLCVQVIL